MKMSGPGLTSAVIYTSISLVVSGLFLVLTLLREHTWVARLGGAGWVFLLSMIVLMPVVIPRVKRRRG
jgi:hypothetical protein